VSSLRRGHANLLCIVPILVYVHLEWTRSEDCTLLILGPLCMRASSAGFDCSEDQTGRNVRGYAAKASRIIREAIRQPIHPLLLHQRSKINLIKIVQRTSGLIEWFLLAPPKQCRSKISVFKRPRLSTSQLESLPQTWVIKPTMTAHPHTYAHSSL